VIHCREIHEDDIHAVVALLAFGFGNEPYWVNALRRLKDHPTPPGLPKYGYVLEHGRDIVGVVLLIFTDVPRNGKSSIRCNISSWYVMPSYRSYGSFLAQRAARHKNVTFFNVTPAPHTWPILEAQGFTAFASGRVLAVPALKLSPLGTRIELVKGSTRADRDLQQAEIDLLLHHKAYGCVSLICESDGRRHPFVFGLERRRRFLRIANLVFCRDVGEFVRFAGPVGRFLALRGYPFVEIQANAPIPGLAGSFSNGRPKFRKGGDRIHPGDIAYSERIIFGYS
jgi:hypothetical protein